jgi:hypothetical protein
MSTTITMTVGEWAAVLDNPRQRDTERHLRSAAHLLNPSPTHAHVSMARSSRTGERWKLDGHTRSLYWQYHPDRAPAELTVTVYEVGSVAEAVELYTHFDNAGAAENVTDRLSGALREVAWRPRSPLFKMLRFTSALRLAEEAVSGEDRRNQETIYKLLPRWIVELKVLDELTPSAQSFKAGIVAAALITIRRHPLKAKEFWSLYVAGKGVKLETEIDGVEALFRLVETTDLPSFRAQQALVTRAVSCFEMWRLGRTYSMKNRARVTPKPTDLARYLAEVR